MNGKEKYQKMEKIEKGKNPKKPWHNMGKKDVL